MPPFLFSEDDPFSPIRYSYSMQDMLYTHRSPFAEISVAEHSYFGRMLVLNGVVQLTERDEYLYHEMLAHVPLHAHPSPQDVLIIGGGDGGTLREVLKHGTVKKAVMAEIDEEVIETSKRFLPTLSTGFSDPRTHVVIADGAEFVARARNTYDIILVDCTDPVGPAVSLFSEHFFAEVHAALRENGIFAAQTESLHFHLDFVREVQHKLRHHFNFVDLYTVPLATYAGNWWTFSIACKAFSPRQPAMACQVSTRYYAEDVHHNAFLVPSLAKRLLG
ncbi:MAG: polyamine aminopropyltransferase [Chloroflexota bacterium]